MSSIMSDFTTISPYLSGTKFNECLIVNYDSSRGVRYRTDVLLDMCRGKRVLHVGCCDHIPRIKRKIDQHEWLQGLLTECSEYTVGVDIDADAVRDASKISGLNNMVAGDVTSGQKIEQIAGLKFDIALFGEVVEHIPNPVTFLNRFRENYGDVVGKIVITVPNAFRGGNFRGALKNIETINSDHRFFFTPYTIAKVATDAGFSPDGITMATFQRAGRMKSLLLQRYPLLAENIIFTGSVAAGPE